ncbi:putative bifunctional diguanylate cyclase/phosphodiesterase [Denitromonas iodatirespirans]|uniref:EAL domain-containing protein n=1 Tax=Denitromonas iodatirespirans TaxID=2795389 RepID=A0A944D8J8_DENI1|nr:GGDEF domain-containing phosphodiesterase [Denitromonas iodatirespirans]MBT0961805.1 EAL domain-containing protein [Denitromonas iodatirespirans]
MSKVLRDIRMRRAGLLVAAPAAVLCLVAGAWRASEGALAAGIGLLAVAVLLGWQELRHLHETFRAHGLAMRGAHDGLWSWNPETKRLWVGDRLLAILGYSSNFLLDTHGWLALVHPDDRANYNRAVARHLKGETPFFYFEYRVCARDGSYRWIASRGEAVRNRRGRAVLMAGSVSDITERKQTEARIQYLAYHDQLTGLANRALLADRLDQAIAQRQRGAPSGVAVLFIDIDRFKDVNDVHGHAVGDVLLVELGRRLHDCVRESDTLVRQGGDEFIMVMSAVDSPASVVPVATKLLEAVRQPLHAGEVELCVSASIGVSLLPDDAADAQTLLRNADTAMYEAKRSGGNLVRFYTRAMNDAVRARVEIESGLRQAIARKELSLHFQPQLSIATGALVGCEALLRWRDAEGHSVPPDRFIPVAEASGQIIAIGEWVVGAALDQILAWRGDGFVPPRVAINVSARQLAQPGFAAVVLAALAARALSPEVLEVEVTESVFLYPDSAALGELRQLRRAGIRLALDDFGTGYSSLSYLGVLPFDTLKIDRSFVATVDAPDDARGDAILKATIAMSRAFAMQVVAEGVERPSQLAALQALSCDVCQGYLFSPPVTGEQFAERCLTPHGASALRCAG